MRFKKFLIAMLALAIACCGLGIVPALAEYNLPHYIVVDLTNQIVTVYNTKDGSIARQMLCSAGQNDATPTGTWYMPAKERSDERSEWYYMGSHNVWVKYATRIYYAYFFHPLTFNRKDDSTMNAKAAEMFGVPASHGCIRLRVEDARYIAEQCLHGTRVDIIKSGVKNEELRSLLYISSYSEDEGITYQEFQGISPDALSLGAAGEEVMDLQTRLRDLGYYGVNPDGRYETETIAAVKALQKDLGIAQSGITTAELKEVIFSDEAPVSKGQVTIQEGSSGPVVKQFQTALQRLGIYEGDIDSVYDADVVDAVRELQRICGYEEDGVASPEVQHLVYYELNRIEQALGTEFSVERVTEEINMATMIFEKSRINVRAKPNTKSDTLTQLSLGDQVVVLAVQDEWAQVIANGKTGFMYKKYLEPFTRENYVLKYTGSGESITIGNTLEQLMSGSGTSEKEAFQSYYASAQYMDYLDDPVEYVTVNTGAEGLKLNMRAAASSEAEVLAEIPNGTKLRVLDKEGDWTRVGYDDQIGYLTNQYLEFWQGTAADVEDSTDALDEGAEEDVEITAIVMPNRRDGSVPVYAEADENSKQIGRLKSDVEVRVLGVDENTGWARISYKDNEGYMQDKNLSFRLGI